MPEFLYLLVNYPALIVVPIIFFAAVAFWSRSRTAWVATVAWAVYLIYAMGIYAGAFCTCDACVRRSPLYFVYPLLAILSAVALVQAYVHVRDKRLRERRPTTRA